ncbi:hypothetical protein ACWYXO_17050 [Janthinobacterium aestuarii]
MRPRNKNEAQEILITLWRGRPEAAFGCAVIDYLSNHLDARHIPFSEFFRLGADGKPAEQTVVINIINYLSGAHLHLLAKGFEYIEGDLPIEIDSLQAKAAYDASINPLTGQFDEAVKRKIFVYFMPSDAAKEVLGEAE